MTTVIANHVHRQKKYFFLFQFLSSCWLKQSINAGLLHAQPFESCVEWDAGGARAMSFAVAGKWADGKWREIDFGLDSRQAGIEPNLVCRC